MDLSIWHLLILVLLLAMGAYARLWLQRRETVKILTSKLRGRRRSDIPIERAILIQPGVLRGFIFLMRWVTRPEFARVDMKRFFSGFYDDKLDPDPRTPVQPGKKVNPHFLGVVYVRMIHRNVVALADPHLIKQVMITMGSKFPKAKQYETLKLVLGNGLVTSGGEIWKRQRALLSKVFTPTNIEKMASSMTTLTLRMVHDEMDRIAGSAPDTEENKSVVLPFDEVISNLTLRIVTTAVFGSRPDFIERMSVLWRDVMSRIMIIALMNLTISDKFSYLPIRVVREFNTSVAALKKLAKGMIDEYDDTLDQQQQQHPGGNQNLSNDTYELLRLMLTVQDEEGNGMDRDLLLDEALTFLFAGHDTTSSWLSSVFWRLAERKDVQRKAQEAVDRAFANLENDELPTVDHLDKMEYLRHVLHEILRLDPPVKIVFKLATETVAVGDIVIPKGSEVFVSIESLHRNPKYWTDRPNEFIPERWTEENLKLQFGNKYKSMLRQCFIPFSTGTRNCIGKYFTQQEAMIIASMILHRFDVEFESEEAAKKAYVHAGPVAHARNLSLRFTRRSNKL